MWSIFLVLNRSFTLPFLWSLLTKDKSNGSFGYSRLFVLAILRRVFWASSPLPLRRRNRIDSGIKLRKKCFSHNN
jgi:hypothetical protein